MSDQQRDRGASVVRAGRVAWAAVGLLVVLAVLAYLVSVVSLVVTAFVLALFPAALLAPAAGWLKRRGVPGAVAALLLVLGLLGGVVATVRLLIPRFAAELPDLLDAASEGVETLREWLDDSALPVELGQIENAARQAGDSLASGDVLGRGLGAAVLVVDVVTGTLLALVTLFFLLKDGPRLWAGVTDLFPDPASHHLDRVGERVWWTLGAYLRGQLLVALFDAVFIGLGLLLLDVPLARALAGPPRLVARSRATCSSRSS